MIIRLLDYQKKEHFVEIPDDTEAVSIAIVSGDMVMTYPKVYDTAYYSRLEDHLDGIYIIKKENFDKLNNVSSEEDLYDIYAEQEVGEK